MRPAGLAATLGRLRIAAARLEDEGRTLVLATDPHPREATYLLNLPAVHGPDQPAPRRDVSLAYDLYIVAKTLPVLVSRRGAY